MISRKFIGITSTALVLMDVGTATAKPQLQLPPKLEAQRPPHNHALSLPPPPASQFGDVLKGLTAAQVAAFATGKEEFENVETPDGGLGPIYNNNSCAACHTAPVIGGASAIFVTRFGRLVNGVFDPLEEKGGSLLQQFAIDPAVHEVIPPEANVVSHRITTPLYGVGLIEAIPDNAIRANAATPKPAGVRGRVSTLKDITTGETRVGRFGWKAQQATLLAFAGDAYLNEMGITSRFFPSENAPNGNTSLLMIFDAFIDPEDTIDPETDKGDIDAAADFMRFLAPPPQLPLSPSASNGRMLFNQISCAACHQPTMHTGPNPIAALDRKPVNLYSDLLIHDMGSLGDGIAQGTARGREMRTAPLWGLRARPVFLHDGRATSVDSAIRAHDGEAATIRQNYLRLTPTQRRQLLDFLSSI